MRMGEEGAGHARHQAAHDVRRELVAEDVHAERFGQQIALTDRARDEPEPRMLEPHQHSGRDEEQRRHQGVELQLGGEGERAAEPRQRAWLRDADEPGRPAEQVDEEIVEEEPDDLRERERDQEVVGSGHAKRQSPDGEGEQRGHHGRDRQRRPERDPDARHQQGGGVGADPHERDVGHVELSGAYLKPQAHRERQVHEDGRGDVEVVRVAGQLRERDDTRCEQRQTRDRRAQSAPRRRAEAAARLHRRAPADGPAGRGSPRGIPGRSRRRSP